MRLFAFTPAVLALAGLAIAFQEPAAKPAPTGPTDEQVIASQLPSYPLTTCPISREPLDSMGKPFDLVNEGRLVRLCCKSCVKEFKKDAESVAKTIKAIDEAVVKEQK